MHSDEVPSSGEFDMRVLWARLRARRAWIAVSVVLFTAAFIAAALLMTPVYRAVTLVVDASSERGGAAGLGNALGQLGGLASLAGINVGAGKPIEESIAVLKSREFTESFIRDLDLMPVLFAERWDLQAGRWHNEDAPTFAEAFRRFDSSIRSVSQDKKSGLVKIEILWREPELAAQWANELIERLNEEMRARAIASTKASMGYLESELGATTIVETRQAISRLMETQINQRMLANVTKEYALRVVDRALPPDVRDVARPNKLLLFALGPLVGFIAGVSLALLAGAWKAVFSESLGHEPVIADRRA
jgi:uncharacterized protein involved in exopolysaccharide biosynthesis